MGESLEPAFFATLARLPRRPHLDAHRDQLDRTRKLIATADANGNFRMADMNRHVETNLSRVIEAIERRMGDPGGEGT